MARRGYTPERPLAAAVVMAPEGDGGDGFRVRGAAMAMIQPERHAERDRIAEEIAKVRAEQKQLPAHWVDKRELLAERLETLVLELLASE